MANASDERTKSVIRSEDAPAAIGPYSQAIKASDLVFLSGQIALDPRTGKLVAGGLEAQTRQVMANLEAVLGAVGGDLGDLVKTTIYLTDLGDFARVNEVYGRYFDEAPPARATVEVSRLPRGALVEIDGIAFIGSPS